MVSPGADFGFGQFSRVGRFFEKFDTKSFLRQGGEEERSAANRVRFKQATTHVTRIQDLDFLGNSSAKNNLEPQTSWGLIHS